MRGGSRRGLVSSSTSAPKKLRDFRQPAKGQVGETPLTIEKGIAGGGSWRAGPCPDGGASLFREAVADMDLVGEDRQGSSTTVSLNEHAAGDRTPGKAGGAPGPTRGGE